MSTVRVCSSNFNSFLKSESSHSQCPARGSSRLVAPRSNWLGCRLRTRLTGDALLCSVLLKAALGHYRFEEDNVTVYQEAVHKMVHEETSTIYVNEAHLSTYSSELAQVRRSCLRLSAVWNHLLRRHSCCCCRTFGTSTTG